MSKLSKKARGKLPASAFAGPGRSFPVNNRGHAEAAIADSRYAPDPAAIKARAKAALARMRGK